MIKDDYFLMDDTELKFNVFVLKKTVCRNGVKRKKDQNSRIL